MSEPKPVYMELWVSRQVMETVIRAAVSYRKVCANAGIDYTIDTAIEAIQEAVHNAWEDPLDTTPL